MTTKVFKGKNYMTPLHSCTGLEIGGRCKQGAIIFLLAGLVVVNFVPKFVAMAMVIDYNSSPVKDNCSLFAPTPLFSGPGYPMVSFKFVPR